MAEAATTYSTIGAGGQYASPVFQAGVSMASSGRVVLLTGAAGGIGRAMTDSLVAAGHSVAAVDRDARALERLVAEFGGARDRLHPIVADLAAETGCQKAVADTRTRFGTVEAVINNAGIGMSSVRPDAEARAPGIEELTPEMWDGFMAIFVRAPVMLVRAALPDMKRGGFGRIVNNTTSYVTMLRVLPYGSAKAALESMSAVWAKELDGSGITVNVLVPGGPTDTALIADESGWPRDKMLPAEIMGPPTAWLVSDEAKGFSGRRITAARWDTVLKPAEAAMRASRAIGWPELSADAVWLTGGKA
jgi:NAD(P)-dependent dehydrogenase (short-subunit alcohol dehydrogenase family)